MKMNPTKFTFGVEDGQFLGYYMTKEGIQPSPAKISKLEETPSPNTLRDAQGMNRKLTTLNRFISKLAEQAMNLFHTLKGCIENKNFRWTPEAESMLQKTKKALHTLPTLANPIPGETLQVYLSASKDTISSVLVFERQGRQLPIFFVIRALRGPKVNYPIIENLVL